MAGNFAQVSDRSFGVPDAVNSGQYVIGIVIDTRSATGSVNLVGRAGVPLTPSAAADELARRPSRADLAPDPRLPADTRLWARLQAARGC